MKCRLIGISWEALSQLYVALYPTIRGFFESMHMKICIEKSMGRAHVQD